MVTAHEQQILNELWEYLTPRRRARFEAVLARRTRCLTVVLEGVEQPHNQSAVLRTAEAMGLQDVHNVESARRFQIARDVARGCDQWLTVHRHRGGGGGTRCCLAELKADGFWILAATPQPPATTLPEITVRQKTALVIGHEKEGVSPAVLEFADERVVIPMSGFVESFNLSVAAALCLFELRAKLDASGVDWKLSDEEIAALKLRWTRLSVPSADAIEHRLSRARESTVTPQSPPAAADH